MVPEICPKCSYPNPNAKNLCGKCGQIFQTVERGPLTSGKKLYGIDDERRGAAPATFEAVSTYNPVMFAALIVIGVLMVVGGVAYERKAGRDLRRGAAAIESLSQAGGKIAAKGAAAPYFIILGGAGCIVGAFRYRRRKDD